MACGGELKLALIYSYPAMLMVAKALFTEALWKHVHGHDRKVSKAPCRQKSRLHCSLDFQSSHVMTWYPGLREGLNSSVVLQTKRQATEREMAPSRLCQVP